MAYVPPGNVSAYQSVYVSQGILKSALPLSDFLAAGIPASGKQVVKAVDAAGAGSLGSAG